MINYQIFIIIIIGIETLCGPRSSLEVSSIQLHGILQVSSNTSILTYPWPFPHHHPTSLWVFLLLFPLYCYPFFSHSHNMFSSSQSIDFHIPASIIFERKGRRSLVERRQLLHYSQVEEKNWACHLKYRVPGNIPVDLFF